MTFDNEKMFEEAVIQLLKQRGWGEVIESPTKEDLIENWAKILFENNRGIDRLNGEPLTKSEMSQIIDQINYLKTPVKLNRFINGKTVSIRRDNPDDEQHFGKDVSLKIYDRNEIAAGHSRYQIARQPQFDGEGLFNNRRGDLMLLINGMPVIHIELKRSGIPVSHATQQISKYLNERIFSGIYSLVQVFVAMTPEETLYFANPGESTKPNSSYFFNWADFNNEPVNKWNEVITKLLSIPMAHQLIGFYTIPDNSDGVLKVLRSYQVHAASAITARTAKVDWSVQNKRGGYIWHTTGSGKTLTSFKSAELISQTDFADKVVFLVDRIELGTQSFNVYQSLAEHEGDVQQTENTGVLVTKLKSNEPQDRLIVTSIQKMSRITEDADGLRTRDINQMRSKRLVFIIDECHRSTFGKMLYKIKNTFKHALYFGFTGTPIFSTHEYDGILAANKSIATSDIFGDELHRYTLSDGINDKNVLGFDPYKVTTFRDQDLKKAVALKEANASDESEIYGNKDKEDKFYEFMNKEMSSEYIDENGVKVKGIEYFIPKSQYETEEHQKMVVKDIMSTWKYHSRNSKFHAILATSSIAEAIQYYYHFKTDLNTLNLKVAALFDISSSENDDGVIERLDGAYDILTDYNKTYNQSYTLKTWQQYKKDISARLAHKEPYQNIGKEPEKQLDLLIVVEQMLTGYDSKWISTLYVDKKLKEHNIIQAFSRTNRLFGPEKQSGIIRYYRYPHTMEKNIELAVKAYSGDRPLDLFVDKVGKNVVKMNNVFERITILFTNSANEVTFSKLPENDNDKVEFARLFNEFNRYLELAKSQGFNWDSTEVIDGTTNERIEVKLTEQDYTVLLLRYQELAKRTVERSESLPFDIEGYLSDKQTGKINSDYMNSNFVKYMKAVEKGNPEDIERTLKELHMSYATLTQEEQKFANLFLADYRAGNIEIEPEVTFRDYIVRYMAKAKNDQITRCAEIFGLDEKDLRYMINLNLTNTTINEHSRFSILIGKVDKEKARNFFNERDEKNHNDFETTMKTDKLLRSFILQGGFEL